MRDPWGGGDGPFSLNRFEFTNEFGMGRLGVLEPNNAPFREGPLDIHKRSSGYEFPAEHPKDGLLLGYEFPAEHPKDGLLLGYEFPAEYPKDGDISNNAPPPPADPPKKLLECSTGYGC